MVDVESKMCEKGGCRLRAAFNMPGIAGSLFCSDHMHPGMVHKFKKVCESVGCHVTASFGVQGSQLRQFCLAHKLDGMVQMARGSKVEL